MSGNGTELTHSREGPLTCKARNQALDITRGFAVLGILLVNIYIASMPPNTSPFLFLKPDVAVADLHAWTFMQIGLIGVSRGLFSLMFGAGMMLLLDRLSTRMDDKSLKVFFFKRMGILFGIGLVHIFGLLWYGDILNLYALCGMMLYFLRNASTKKLVTMMIVFSLMATAMPAMMAAGAASYEEAVRVEAAGEELSQSQKDMKKSFAPMMDPETILEGDRAQTEIILADFSGVYILLAGLSIQFLIVNFIMAMWDCMFMMVIGIWMYRRGWLTGEASTATYVKMIVIGFGVGLGLRIYWYYQFWQQDFAMDYAMINLVALQPVRLLIAVGVIGVVQLFARSAYGQMIKSSIAAVGQMALTNYISHSVFFALVFYGFGLGLYNSMTGWQVIGLGLLIFATQMAASSIWLHYYRFGPIEWLWRSLTYGKRQAMVRVQQGD